MLSQYSNVSDELVAGKIHGRRRLSPRGLTPSMQTKRDVVRQYHKVVV